MLFMSIMPRICYKMIRDMNHLFLGNYRESQRELQKWFARQQQETLLKHQIPEDTEIEREDDTGRRVSEDTNVDEKDTLNREGYTHSTTLDDVKIRMANQEDAENNDQLMEAMDNQRELSKQNVQSLSMTQRFRYPPKGYDKHVPYQRSGNVLNSRPDRTNTGINTTLTSTISQKIHLDRIQEENSSSNKRAGENIRPKSGRISGT